MTSDRIQTIYLRLLFMETVAASLIWGINTLFLLDAGLDLTGAFIANGAFSAGYVLFEIPTGVVADAAGRRVSYMLGAVTLLITTVGYLLLWQTGAGLLWWVAVSLLMGLGFTFFSGATEAWVVDALNETGFDQPLETVFGRGKWIMGVATMVGTIGGGFLAQASFGLPYVVRSIVYLATIGAAFLWMHDIGFTPTRGDSITSDARRILANSIEHGVRNRPVRMFMLVTPFLIGVQYWAFYAFQPYILELVGDPDAIYLAGLAGAGTYAIGQMIGGPLVKVARRLARTRTGIVVLESVGVAVALVVTGIAALLPIPFGFWLALVALIVVLTLMMVAEPIVHAFINDVIPSEQRATVLSFQSLLGGSGGMVIQPALGRVADVYSIGAGYLVAAGVYLLRLPFALAVRSMGVDADQTTPGETRPRVKKHGMIGGHVRTSCR